MHTTRVPFLLLSFALIFFVLPALAQTPTFSRIDTATELSLSGGVTVGDFDGDGFPDLVLQTHSGTEALGLHFLRGLGDGTFAAPIQVFSGCCASVGAADVNGDGSLDLVFHGVEAIWVLPGNGDGSFAAGMRTPTRAYSAREPLLLDFNGDGRIDIALANQDGGVSVLPGNGDGTFGATATFPIGGGSVASGLAAGDFNGDGVLDIAASNPGPPDFDGTNVSVLLGAGDGSFGPPTDFTVGTLPFPLVTADFNADGNVDIAVANYKSASVSLLLGHGDGTFAPRIDALDGAFPVGLGAADFNGDGQTDVAIGGAATSLAVLLGNGDGTLGSVNALPSLTSAQSLALADFNLDGRPDVVIVYLPPANAFSVFLNTTSTDTTAPVVTVSANPSILLPPNRMMVPVTLTGTVTDTGSDVALASATFAVEDEYGLVQPSGSIQVHADGSYSVQIMLAASRRGSDTDGRTYRVTVTVTDQAGNTAAVEAIVRVAHDRGR